MIEKKISPTIKMLIKYKNTNKTDMDIRTYSNQKQIQKLEEQKASIIKHLKSESKNICTIELRKMLRVYFLELLFYSKACDDYINFMFESDIIHRQEYINEDEFYYLVGHPQKAFSTNLIYSIHFLEELNKMKDTLSIYDNFFLNLKRDIQIHFKKDIDYIKADPYKYLPQNLEDPVYALFRF